MCLGDAAKVNIKNFDLFKKQEIPLSRFMVFIGRNDTGKTTLLRALADILTPEPRNRRGTWVPTPEIAEELAADFKFALRDVQPDEIHIYGRDDDVGVRLDSRELVPSHPPVDDKLDRRLRAPVGEVVWLDLGDLGRPEKTVERFLVEWLPEKLVSVADEATRNDGDDAEQLWPSLWLAHSGPDAARGRLFEIDPAGRKIEVRKWVQDALEELSTAAYGLLPAFARRYYSGVVLEIKTDPAFAPWSYRVALQPRDDYLGRPLEFDELASGVRAWLTLAIREAARRILTRVDRLTVDSFTLKRSAAERPRVLYLVDEPERHLHPEAQREAARWLLERLGDLEVEAGVAVATHSPAFVDLPRGIRTLYLCTRDEDGAEATVTTWPGEELEDLYDLAVRSGMTLSDIFLSASVVLLVEGKTEEAYVPAVWRLLFGTSPYADGVRVIPVGGVNHARPLIHAFFDKLSERPIHFLVDNPDLDQAQRGKEYEQLKRDYDVTVHAHHRFDAWALIPEPIVERLSGIDQDRLHEKIRKQIHLDDVPPDWWRAIEERRKTLLEEPWKIEKGEGIPNASKLLNAVRKKDLKVDLHDQFCEALRLLADDWEEDPTVISERIREIFKEVRNDALYSSVRPA